MSDLSRDLLSHGLAAFAIGMLVTLAACSSSPDPNDPRFHVSEGKALQDLGEARRQGVIDRDQYEDQKEEILDRYEN